MYLFFLLQMIAIIFDDAIYLFIYFLHFISMLLRPSPILKTIQKMGERNETKQQLYNSKQIIIILPMKYERRYHNICWGAVAWWLTPRTQNPEVVGFEPHLGRRVVSLSKIYLPTKSTGNTQEAVASSQHDWKIVYGDVKLQTNQKQYLFSWFLLFVPL